MTPLAAFDLAAYERWLQGFAFYRTCVRKARGKRPVDCHHGFIDATEPYRYSVWKLNSTPRDGGVEQRAICEFCAREDQVAA